jgi:hypothetical protein
MHCLAAGWQHDATCNDGWRNQRRARAYSGSCVRWCGCCCAVYVAGRGHAVTYGFTQSVARQHEIALLTHRRTGVAKVAHSTCSTHNMHAPQ